jgi:mRNA-degrading endonuclease toxin of MazEF toxin-antitoxin module
VQIKLAGKNTEIAVDQIRVVSSQRLRGKVGELQPGQAAELREVLRMSYAE